MGKFSQAAAEAMAAMVAMELCRELGLIHVYLERDAKTIIDAVNCEEEDWSRTGHLVDDIKVGLQRFVQWRLCFVK